MNYKDIITIVSKELNLPYKVVDKTYKAYWGSIKSIIEDLPLKEDLSQEEFNQLKTNFNITIIKNAITSKFDTTKFNFCSIFDCTE